MCDAAPAEYKVNDKVFILDMEHGRVFPAIVTKVKNPKIWYTDYKVKLDETSSAYDRHFKLPDDEYLHSSDLFNTAAKAYHAMLNDYKREREELTERLERIPYLIRDAEERLVEINKADGAVYKLEDTVWVIHDSYDMDAEVVESVIKQYDICSSWSRFYFVVGKRKNYLSDWYRVDQIYTTKEAAVKALKDKLKQEYNEKLSALE